MPTPKAWIMLTILWGKMLMRQRYKIVGESRVLNQLTRKQWNDPKLRYPASHLSIMIILLSITREFTRPKISLLKMNAAWLVFVNTSSIFILNIPLRFWVCQLLMNFLGGNCGETGRKGGKFISCVFMLTLGHCTEADFHYDHCD